MDYVQSILENEMVVQCEDRKKIEFLKTQGAVKKWLSKNTWVWNFNGDQDLSEKLQELRDFGFMFAGGTGGWYPSDVILSLKEKELFSGQFTEVLWHGQNKPFFRLI